MKNEGGLTAEEISTIDRVDREVYPYGRAVRDIADLRDIIDRLTRELAKRAEKP